MSIEEIEELHRKAIEKADLAMIENHNKNYGKALKLNEEAFHFEKLAALFARKIHVGEPSESVLLESACSLGLLCGEDEEVQDLMAIKD